MTTEERAYEIVSAILDMCGLELREKRPQLEAFVARHLDEVERRSAEKAVGVYREKTSEAADTVFAKTAVGGPTDSP